MSNEKPSVAGVLHSNRKVVIALLGVPILGMLIAVVLLVYKRPENLLVVLGVMLFVGIQYILMMFFFMKKIETLAKKEQEEIKTTYKPGDARRPSNEIPQSDPEEERLFSKKEDKS